MTHLPFTITDLYGDFAEANGIARLEDDTLVLEYQTKDSILGIIKSDVKIVRIPLLKLSSVRFEKKWFKNFLFISAQSMATLADVPGCEQGTLRLTISKKYRALAEQFSAEAELRMAELNLKNLDSDME
jgi:hypothetical protein